MEVAAASVHVGLVPAKDLVGPELCHFLEVEPVVDGSGGWSLGTGSSSSLRRRAKINRETMAAEKKFSSIVQREVSLSV